MKPLLTVGPHDAYCILRWDRMKPLLTVGPHDAYCILEVGPHETTAHCGTT